MHERMIGRADLLNALRLAEQEHDASPDHLAGLLGFRRNAAETRPVPDSDNDDSRPDEAPITARSTVTPTPTSERPPLSTSMWMLTELRRFDLHPPKDEETPEANPGGQTAARPLRDEDGLPRCTEPLPAQHLVERHRLWPALRRSLSEERRHGVDLAALVRSLVRAHLPPQMPQRRDRRWVNDVLVIWDTSVRLTPYQADFEMIVSEVGARHGGAGLRLWRLHGQPEAGFDCREVHSAGLVLVLSDLGNLAVDEGLRAGWRRVLHACRAQGARVVAWLPHGERLVDREAAELGAMHCLVARSVRCGPVRHGAGSAAIRGERQRLAGLRETLLVRAAVCLQLEVALLRRLRKTDAALQAEPGVEAMAWNHQPVVRTSLVSRALAPEHAAGYRKQFSMLSAEIQGEVLREVTEVHSREGRSTEMVETLIWQTHARPEAAAAQDNTVQTARQWCRNLAAKFQQDALHGESRSVDRDFAADLTSRTAHDAAFVESQSEWFDSIWGISGFLRVPDGMSAERAFRARQRAHLEPLRSITTYRPVLRQGEIWLAEPLATSFSRLQTIGPNWSMSAAVVTDSSGKNEQLSFGRELVKIAPRALASSEVLLQCEFGQLKWKNIKRPTWASEWGRDKYGAFADLVVDEAVQRFRYIEPGSFFMGSPESEYGRTLDEGPSHIVTITEGLWMTDTACTQALWQAVTGKTANLSWGNESFPVESISWDDCQIFMDLLRRKLSIACKIMLPTEAEWEYSCRANDFSVDLNSRKAIEFNQYRIQALPQITPVKSIPPNSWGLFQMIGNISEWCHDRQRKYSNRNLMDPDGGQSGEKRVVRGGAWDLPFDRSRPASRHALRKTIRRKGTGFRFVIRLDS